MRKFSSVLGWLLVALAGMWLFAALLFGITADASDGQEPALGALLLTAIFGIPGGVIRWRIHAARKREAFEAEFRGYLMSFDAFTPAELAVKIGRTEMETSGLIARTISEHDDIDLVFHRSAGQFLHRNRIRRAHQVIDRCGSCGASVGHEIVFAGESVSCRYCGTLLETA
ncbi:MAG: hypothetical protein ACPG4T_05515 [Nannocystaceae bacterium]